MEKDRRRFTYLESVFSLDFFGCLGGSKGRTKLFECLYYFCQIDSTSLSLPVHSVRIQTRLELGRNEQFEASLDPVLPVWIWFD